MAGLRDFFISAREEREVAEVLYAVGLGFRLNLLAKSGLALLFIGLPVALLFTFNVGQVTALVVILVSVISWQASLRVLSGLLAKQRGSLADYPRISRLGAVYGHKEERARVSPKDGQR